MASSNRALLLSQAYRLLRRTYDVSLPSTERSVLEQAVFAVLLEDSTLKAAETTYSRLQKHTYDWNEARVSSPRELAECLDGLSEPLERARRVKAILQHVFETHYQFDLDWLRRKTLGQASKELRKIKGVTPFVEAFVVQAGLKGHTIPLDESALRVFRRLGFAREDTSPEELRASLERLIPKSRGPAFCSLIRQLAHDVCHSDEPKVNRCVLVEICPTGQEVRAAPPTARRRGTRQPAAPRRKTRPTPKAKHR